MSTAIIFRSKHGTTEKVVNYVASKLSDPNVEIINLKEHAHPKIDSFDTLLIGGSIHFGGLQKHLIKFCAHNKNKLLGKRIGLFLCCMYNGERAQKQFEEVYPEVLRKHSTSNGLLGGEFLFEKMNFLEKKIVQKVVGISKSQSKIDYKAIDEFTNGFN
ncbi:MAG: flavodoxin domain-containing protein [Marinifilaceae bacterium]